MANDILAPGSNGSLQVPDYLKGRDLGVTTSLLQGMFQGGNRIGLKGSRFRLVVNGIEEGVIEENYLDVIILGAAPAVSRVYYAGAYKQGENSAPTCYSADGVTPAADVHNKQSEKCATCPQNVKGSKIVDGAKYKACAYFRRVVVMLAGDTADRRVFKLDVKGQGLFGENTPNEKNFNDYVKMISTRGVEAGQIVTRITFDINASVPKLVFKAVRFVTEEEIEAVTDLVQGEEVATMKEVSMATLDLSGEEPTDGDAPEPQAAKPQTATKPQAAKPQTATKPQAAKPQVQSNVPPPQAAKPATTPKPQVQEVSTADELESLLNELE